MAFDYNRLQELKSLLKKAQFVPLDPSMAGGNPAAAGAGAPPPDAGAMPPDAGAMPPDAGAMPPDAGAMPPDAGMPPPDAGAMPPMDPMMAGGDPMAMPPPDSGDVSPTGEPYMKITPTQLSKLFKQFAEVFKSVLGIQQPAAGQVAPTAVATNPQQDAQLAELNAKLDAIIHG